MATVGVKELSFNWMRILLLLLLHGDGNANEHASVSYLTATIAIAELKTFMPQVRNKYGRLAV